MRLLGWLSLKKAPATTLQTAEPASPNRVSKEPKKAITPKKKIVTHNATGKVIRCIWSPELRLRRVREEDRRYGIKIAEAILCQASPDELADMKEKRATIAALEHQLLTIQNAAFAQDPKP